MRGILALSAALLWVGLAAAPVRAEAALVAGTGSLGGFSRLVAAYPQALDRIEGNDLIWRDGTRMAVDDGLGPKSHADWLALPDIKDMLAFAYPAGKPFLAPAPDFDPGRARNGAFFDKLYGACRSGEVEGSLVTVVWLPKKYGKRIAFSSRHGAAERLAAVSARLDELPASFDVYLKPPAGTYNCRVIAGTDRVSAHGHGIAIDIATKHAHYWRWPGAGVPAAYRNEIPVEIVAAFEAEGFIWGGRWSHYDTMHFEYRPELLGR
ncbi:MAG: M15 family metallopeptidase [Hyphomicrobiaceae bacterium]